jgi:hypothetical protein
MDIAELARGLDHEFRASCSRLNCDEPWLGTFTMWRSTRSARCSRRQSKAASSRSAESQRCHRFSSRRRMTSRSEGVCELIC